VVEIISGDPARNADAVDTGGHTLQFLDHHKPPLPTLGRCAVGGQGRWSPTSERASAHCGCDMATASQSGSG
jgi:hypothetical protein